MGCRLLSWSGETWSWLPEGEGAKSESLMGDKLGPRVELDLPGQPSRL